MNLGNKIVELRKKHNLSQEKLAEKVGVTRQTISKWELNETAPDIKQAKELSKIFKISLDELVNNEIKDVVIEKVSNTEKLAGMIIKVIKITGIFLITLLIIDVIALIAFSVIRKENMTSTVTATTLYCTLENNEYKIDIGSDAYFNCSNCSTKIQSDINQIIDYSDIEKSAIDIEQYFITNNGRCQ